MDGWLLADSNGVENQNQRPFYVGRRSVARARVNSLICLMVDREQSLSLDPSIPPHFIWKSAAQEKSHRTPSSSTSDGGADHTWRT